VQDEIVFLSAEDATNSSKGKFPALQIVIKNYLQNSHMPVLRIMDKTNLEGIRFMPVGCTLM
jgi:hypothetical protein